MEIAPRAWEQLGKVPGDVFWTLQRELAEIAARLSANDSGVNRGEKGSTLEAGAYQVHYEVDPENRRVLLQKLVRRAEEDPSDELTSTGRRRRKA